METPRQKLERLRAEKAARDSQPAEPALEPIPQPGLFDKIRAFYNTGPDEDTRQIDMTGQAPVFDSDKGAVGTVPVDRGENRQAATHLGVDALLGLTGAKLFGADKLAEKAALKEASRRAFAEKVGGEWAATRGAGLGREFGQESLPKLVDLAYEAAPRMMDYSGGGVMGLAKRHPLLTLLGGGAAAKETYDTIKKLLGL